MTCLLLRNDNKNILKDKKEPTLVHIHLFIFHSTNTFQIFGWPSTKLGTVIITLMTAHITFPFGSLQTNEDTEKVKGHAVLPYGYASVLESVEEEESPRLG